MGRAVCKNLIKRRVVTLVRSEKADVISFGDSISLDLNVDYSFSHPADYVGSRAAACGIHRNL